MKTVWKFPFSVVDDFVLKIPRGARILHVAAQGYGLRAQPAVWALVDPDAPPESRRFHLAGTGHPLADGVVSWLFVGSFLLNDGQLVFHLWEDLWKAPEPKEGK